MKKKKRGEDSVHKKLSKKEKKEKLLFEIRRKAIHSLAVISIPIYYILNRLFDRQITLLLFLFVLMVFIIIEFFRIVKKQKIPIVHIFWRAKEENSLSGLVYFMIGIIIAFTVFDTNIAYAAILMAVFGDMAAAIFGIAFGKHWIKQLNETAWEGIIAEFIVDIIIAWIIFQNWFIVLPMAAIATLVETIFPHVDDNLAIPVFAGFVGQCLKLIVG
jgi:phytol kinase